MAPARVLSVSWSLLLFSARPSFREVDDHLADLATVQPVLHAELDVLPPEIFDLQPSSGSVFNQRVGGEGIGSSVDPGGPVQGPREYALPHSLMAAVDLVVLEWLVLHEFR